MPKFFKILFRAGLRQEILPFAVWFLLNRGWTVWTTGRRLVQETVPFCRPDGVGEAVIVAGDSLAMGVGLKCARTSSVAALLGDKFVGSPVVNLSRIGRSISGVRNTFKRMGILPRYKCVVIMAGTVDMIMNTPSDVLERDLRELYEILGRATDHVVLVQAGSMAAGPRFAGYTTFLEALAKRSDRVHQLFERVSKEYSHVEYLGELFDWSLLDSTRSEPERWFSPDGFHPSEAWHQKVFEALVKILRARNVLHN